MNTSGAGVVPHKKKAASSRNYMKQRQYFYTNWCLFINLAHRQK